MFSFANMPQQDSARLSAPPSTFNWTALKSYDAPSRHMTVDPALLEMQNPVDRPRLKIKFKNPSYKKDKEQLPPVRQTQELSMEIDSPKRRRLSHGPPVAVSESMMSAQMSSLVEQEETPTIKPEPTFEYSRHKLLIEDDGLDEASPFTSLYPPLAEVPNRRAESCPPSLPNPTFLEPISATTSETQDSIFSTADDASSQSSTRSNMLSVLCVLAGMKQKQPIRQDSIRKLKPVNIQWNGSFPYSPFSSTEDLTKQALERKALQNRRRAAMRARVKEESESEAESSTSSLSELSESEEESELSSLDELEIVSIPTPVIEPKQEPKPYITSDMLYPPIAKQTLSPPELLNDFLTPPPVSPAKPVSLSLRLSAPKDVKPKAATPNLGLTVLKPTAKHYRRTQPNQHRLTQEPSSTKKKKSNKDWVTDSKKRKRKSEPKKTQPKRGKKGNVWGQKEAAWPGGEFDFYVDVPPMPKELRPKKRKGPKWYYEEVDDVPPPIASTSQLPPSRRSASLLPVAPLPARRSRSRSSRPAEPAPIAEQEDISAALDSAIADIPNQDMDISLDQAMDLSFTQEDIAIPQQGMDIDIPISRSHSIPTESSVASLSFGSVSTTAYATPPSSDDIAIPPKQLPTPQFARFLYGSEIYPSQ